MNVFAQLLDDTRRRLERRRWWNRRLWWPLPWTPGTSLQRQEHRKLLRRGRVVWAAVAQANNQLYEFGTEDLPGNIVYSPDPYFDAHPFHLTWIADKVYALKDKRLDQITDVGKRAVAMTIRDEYNMCENMLLPESLTERHEVYFSSLLFMRTGLLGCTLSARLVPVLMLPEETPQQLLLPATAWPKSLRRQWGQLEALKPVPLRWEYGQMPDESRRAYPHQRPWEAVIEDQQQRITPPESGIVLTPAAARALAEVIEQHQLAPLAKIERLSEGHRFSMIEDWDPQTQRVVESRGVKLVVDNDQWEQLSGTLVDFRSSSQGQGFTFVKAENF